MPSQFWGEACRPPLAPGLWIPVTVSSPISCSPRLEDRHPELEAQMTLPRSLGISWLLALGRTLSAMSVVTLGCTPRERHLGLTLIM